MIIDIRGRFYYKLDTKVNGRWLHIILYIKGTSDQFVNLQNMVKFPSVGNFSTARISATNISTTDNLPKVCILLALVNVKTIKKYMVTM